MSHLVLDEIYAVEWKSGRWRFKKSFGTAIKFWGDDGWANFSTYAKLVIVAMMILGEPTVLEQLDARTRGSHSSISSSRTNLARWTNCRPPQSVLEAAQTAIAPPGYAAPSTPWPPATTFQDYDTAQRPGPPYPQ